MGIRAFTLIKRPLLELVLWILCLVCWGLGGCIYAYGVFEAIRWTFVFPHPNLLAAAIWLMQLALRLFCLWVPLGFLLIYWKNRTKLIFIAYLVGCGLALGLGLLAGIMVMPYLDQKLLRSEYFELINQQLAKGKFPYTIRAAIKAYKCCSWYGPTDFGEVFNMTEKKDTDLKFMTHVARCYGGIFTVEQRGDSLVYTSVQKARSDVPVACGVIYKTAAARICNFIFFMNFFQIILTTAIIVLYLICYTRMGKGQVAPEGHHHSKHGKKKEADNMISTESVPSSVA